MRKSNKEILCENAAIGFEEFEERMLKLTKESIFNNAFEINAKKEIFGYLCDCSAVDLEENEIKVLVGLGDAVIDELYCYFMDENSASVMFYEDIKEWVQDFCEEAMKGEI